MIGITGALHPARPDHVAHRMEVEMPQGTPVPQNESGALHAWAADIIGSLSRAWSSPRGLRIARVLQAYCQQKRIVFEVLKTSENAVWRSSQQIAIFVQRDATVARLMQRPGRTYDRGNLGGWLISPDDHVLERSRLILSLAHEGLHAAQATPGDGCLEEEIDGRLAGNAAAKVMGLAAGHRMAVNAAGLAAAVASLRKSDYPDLASDPAYTPLGGAWPTPWATEF
jgi:hypothetical protein